MPKNGLSALCKNIQTIGGEHGIRVNRDYARKLAVRYLTDQAAQQDLEANGLQHDPLTYKDETGEKAVRAWFAALINQEAEVAA